MADEDIKIKDLPRTESVNDDDDVVIEDASPTTYRIHASDLRSYVAKSVQDSIDQMEKEITANTNAITENTNNIQTNKDNIQTNKESISELNTDLTEVKTDLAYQKGDRITASYIETSGYVTNSSADIRFCIPLNKPVADGVNISLSCGLIIRQNGSYTHGSESSTAATPSSMAVTIQGTVINVRATMSDTTNAQNNAAAGVLVNNPVITFS